MTDIYVSVDIEADGPIPGMNSMLGLGAAAFVLPSREPVATFEVMLELLVGAEQDRDTMEWWAKQPEAWEYVRSNLQSPALAMERFIQWLKDLPGNPTFVGYPASYDFMWVHWYIIRFCGWPSPFGFSALDLKTLAMARMGTTFKGTVKRKMPKKWFEGAPKHTHRPLDDAIGQGVMFVNMMKEF